MKQNLHVAVAVGAFRVAIHLHYCVEVTRFCRSCERRRAKRMLRIRHRDVTTTRAAKLFRSSSSEQREEDQQKNAPTPKLNVSVLKQRIRAAGFSSEAGWVESPETETRWRFERRTYPWLAFRILSSSDSKLRKFFHVMFTFRTLNVLKFRTLPDSPNRFAFWILRNSEALPRKFATSLRDKNRHNSAANVLLRQVSNNTTER